MMMSAPKGVSKQFTLLVMKPFSPTAKSTIIRIINTMENDSTSDKTDYSSIYLYKDGANQTKRQVTLGRGFTSMGGALWKVIQRYIDNGGKEADFFASYKNKMSNESLCDDKAFLKALVKASLDEQTMRDAQDEIYDEVYWQRGEKWFNTGGFTLPLSMGIIQDSMMQSGGMFNFLMAKFPEKKPIDGGQEKVWVNGYIAARYNWLWNKSPLLRNTVYRLNCYKTLIKNDNWQLSLPIISNSRKIS